MRCVSFRIQILQFELMLKLRFSSVIFGGDLEALSQRICLQKSVNVETILTCLISMTQWAERGQLCSCPNVLFARLNTKVVRNQTNLRVFQGVQRASLSTCIWHSRRNGKMQMCRSCNHRSSCSTILISDCKKSSTSSQCKINFKHCVRVSGLKLELFITWVTDLAFPKIVNKALKLLND